MARSTYVAESAAIPRNVLEARWDMATQSADPSMVADAAVNLRKVLDELLSAVTFADLESELGEETAVLTDELVELLRTTIIDRVAERGLARSGYQDLGATDDFAALRRLGAIA